MTTWHICATIHQVGDLTGADIENVALVELPPHLGVRLLGFHHSAQEYTLRAQMTAPAPTMGQALDVAIAAVEEAVFPLLPDACHIRHVQVHADTGPAHPLLADLGRQAGQV